MTTKCSAINCTEVGTQFDGATIELFACKEHEKKWRDQMIDLGVSCLNNYRNGQTNPKCDVSSCNKPGYFYMVGVTYRYCIGHSDVGEMCSFVNENDDVIKLIVRSCKKFHLLSRINNGTENCWCGSTLHSSY